MSDISKSAEYLSFRGTISQKKIIVDERGNKEWKLYDAGPRSVRCPVMFLPPVSGTADIFFKQMLSLTSQGFRVISLEYPVYWTVPEFCEGMRKLLDHLNINKIHLFGASLGGYMAQKFAEYTYRSPRVASLILCNTFVDTSVFHQTGSANLYWVLPGFALKKMVMGNFANHMVDPCIADSIDFMVERLDSLNQAELASRLTLNCIESYVEPQKLGGLDITILDVFDGSALSLAVKEELYKCYPMAKRAHLKKGGNFPYLSKSEEVTMHIKVHLRPYLGTKLSARDPTIRDQFSEPDPASVAELMQDMPAETNISLSDSEGDEN